MNIGTDNTANTSWQNENLDIRYLRRE
jgi:hypothetical protein